MTDKETMQTDEATASKSFVFSSPNIVSKPNRATSFGANSDHVLDPHSSRKTVFTFAEPTAVEQSFEQSDVYTQAGDNVSEKHYKPKISRNAFKVAIPYNALAQALKETTAFEQLKKNSRSQTVKVDIECSITCSNVPLSLLKKKMAREYFQTFGQIIKIAIRPKKHVIRVFYATKDQANMAYMKSGEYLGEEFDVEWTKSNSSHKPSTKKTEVHKNMVANLLTVDKDEVTLELDAMVNLEYNIHNDYAGSNPEPSIFNVKKSRGAHSKSLSKHEKSGLKSEKSASKTEKPESESHMSTPLPAATIEELQHIVHQAALTSEEKYKVLEARDKLMRMKQVKSHSLAMAKVTRGSCPDMCPEKERLMRESQRQVAPYEQMNCAEYKINHAIAVKQYSRSSADQEEPMSHDLRPVKSLKMTMSYLLHEVTDLSEKDGTNLAEWYHFLWDRTRSIRKDITIQELCCPDSVELVEQCARFHIVCSERLCAEQSSVFDKKINSENLTKCLQSLKYMYHDLRVKGVTCKNEPEFRAYVILLNLNTANFMSDLQRLPVSIQKSPEVKFSVEVYTSLESNNYCKFFKLVRKTTYLNACILLRYFNQVRVKALSVMVKAYCRTMSTAYPLYELIDNLGFEDENEAIHFCEQVGLQVSDDELHVLLNRQNFSLPVSNIKQGRACNMVESKRIMLEISIGQCIAGGIMPEQTYKSHKPHNSFDSQGRLTLHSINAEDQNPSISHDKEDPYEFVDDDSMDSVQTPTQQEDNKQNIFFADKYSPTTESDFGLPNKSSVSAVSQSNMFKPISAPGSNVNVFQPIKSDKEFPTKIVSATQATSDSSPFKTHPVVSGTFVPRSSPFKFSHSEATTSESPLSSSLIFSNTARIPSIFSKPSGQSGMQPDSFGTPLPFTMPTNKITFPGIQQKNIFAKPSTSSSSSVFARTHSITQNTSQPYFSAKDTTESKFQQSQSLPIQTERNQQVKVEKVDVEKIKQDEMVRKRKLQQVEEDAGKLFIELQADVIKDCCSTIIREEINRIAMYDSISEKIYDDIFNQACHETCTTVLTEEIIMQQKLHEITKTLKNRITLKYLNMWKRHTNKQKRQREALDDTPVWIQKQSVETCAKQFYQKQQKIVIENMSKKPYIEYVEKPFANYLAPIEIIIHAGVKENQKSLDTPAVPTYFWKLVISWPDLENKVILWRHKKIINQYLCPSNYTTEPIVKSYRPNEYESLHICIRHFEGLISDYKLIGTDALLFIAAATEDFKCVNRRLTRTVLSRDKLMPVPLVFLILGEGNLESRTEDIVADLEVLLESGYVSEYTITVEKTLSEKVILNLVQSAILWLTVNKSPPNPLEMDYIHNIYNLCLTEELWLRITGDSMFNTKLSRALNEPNFVIDIHNEAIMLLMDVTLDPESLMYTKFSPELKRFLKSQPQLPFGYEYFDDTWKKDEYRALLENTMNNFILPSWSAQWPIRDTQLLHQSVMQYCQQVLSDSNSNVVTCDILSKIFLSTGSLRVTNFVDILLSIVKEKINLLSEKMKVVYNKNHIKHFRTLPWWFKSNVLTEYIAQDDRITQGSANDEQIVAKKRKINDDVASTEDHDPLGEFCKDTQEKVMDVHYTSKVLENRLKEQQLQSQLLEEKLMKALNGEADKLC